MPTIPLVQQTWELVGGYYLPPLIDSNNISSLNDDTDFAEGADSWAKVEPTLKESL